MNSKTFMGAVAALGLAACNTPTPTTPASTPAAASTTAAAASTGAAATGTAAATTGGEKSAVNVTVAFTGTAPTPAKLKREADPFCAKTPMTSEDVLVKDGKLANVMVRVTKGAEGTFPAPATPALITQDNCMYRPRVVGAVTGQTIQIESKDQTGHNVHTYKGDESLFNRAQNAPGSFTKTTDDMNTKDGVITFKCDIHPWMTGYVVVNSNPYFAVTDATGVAKLDLPPGKYTIEAWHEKYGTKTQDVTVEAGKPLDLKFEYSGTEKSGS